MQKEHLLQLQDCSYAISQRLCWVKWEWIWSHINSQRGHAEEPYANTGLGDLHPWTGSMWASCSTGGVTDWEYQSWSLSPPVWIWGQNSSEVICDPNPVCLHLLLGNSLNESLGKDKSRQRAVERWAVEVQPWIITAAKMHCSPVALITFIVREMFVHYYIVTVVPLTTF